MLLISVKASPRLEVENSIICKHVCQAIRTLTLYAEATKIVQSVRSPPLTSFMHTKRRRRQMEVVKE